MEWSNEAEPILVTYTTNCKIYFTAAEFLENTLKCSNLTSCGYIFIECNNRTGTFFLMSP